MTKQKNKMTKDVVPEGFTIPLAIVDFIPVLFCGLSCILIGNLFHSTLFILSSIVIVASGAIKVLWKILVVTNKKNYWPLFVQMRIVMPIGFLGLLISLIINYKSLSLSAILQGLTHFPSSIFFLIGFIGMGLMIYFAKNLDSSDLKSNWIEQITNGVAQICFFIGLLLL